MTFEFDPFIAIGLLLSRSVIVSIMSGVYYFKLYELMSQSASSAEIASNLYRQDKVYVAHDKDSFILTGGLVISLRMWFCIIC